MTMATDNKTLYKKQDDLKEMCPFVEDSHKDCYCVNMNSWKTGYAVYYSGDKFTECKIYNRIKNEEFPSYRR